MNLLREYIRALLTESARQPEDLPEGVKVVIENRRGHVVIYYAHDNPGQANDGRPTGIVRPFSPGIPWGQIDILNIQDREDTGPCDGAWKVSGSEAKPGWGPMLYDIAMEWATLEGNGLIADRDSVSPSAHKVWDHYLHSRGDVMDHQLDNFSDELTPTIQVDNCNQEVSEQDEFVYPWHASPLSKRYTKPPAQIEKLRALGKLKEWDL